MANRWETHIKPYLKEIEKWAKAGDNSKEISKKLNVGYSTFRKYVTTEPDLNSIIRNSSNYVQKVIEKALTEEPGRDISRGKTPPPPMTTYVAKEGQRLDQNGPHRKMFEKNKKKIYATQKECAICGKPVDFSMKYPHPLSPCIDHIIPVSKGGHPSDISNLQLAHWTCNRQKSDKITIDVRNNKKTITSNRILPQSCDWKTYKAGGKKQM